MAGPDAIVVGSGPNGLAAAITLAQAGVSVQVLEAEATIGGAARSAELTLPGFVHDVGSGIHPLAYDSPFFRKLPLRDHGLEWVHSPAPLAHPLGGGDAVTLEVDVRETAAQLGEDAGRYARIFTSAASTWADLLKSSLSVAALARHAPAVAFLGLSSAGSATGFVRWNFRNTRARALIAGMAAHSTLPLSKFTTGGIAIALATTGHVGGWPFPRGGAQKISDALASYLRSLGGTITTGMRVRNLRELPPARAVLLDVTPRQFLQIAGEQLPQAYTKFLSHFRYGVGAYKLDWALSEPVPWTSPALRRAATVHIGGGMEEIKAYESSVWKDTPGTKPFAIVAQHSLFDPTRAPAGKHTLWAYCHVPNGSEIDMTRAVEDQIERFAPGFREAILARSVLPPRRLESLNANLIGGDIMGGMQDLYQMLIRPTMRYWTTPLDGVYLCSASTPPGGGVHGMCGHIAARIALKQRVHA
jgi:phytoene dehydrogenase-like protein